MAERSQPTSPVTIVGLVGGDTFGPEAAGALRSAEVIVGSARHLAAIRPGGSVGSGSAGDASVGEGPERIELRGPLGAVIDTVEQRAGAGRHVCVLASGDPGFFGIVRAIGARLGPDRLAVHPAPSSVALAFALVGLSWDDAAVVSAHGRDLGAAARLATGPKIAVLTSPDNPPQAIGAALLGLGCGARRVAVASRLGEEGQALTRTDLAGLAAGTFDPMSVVILTVPDPAPGGPGLAWGLPEARFEHRDRMITKAEVRAVALGKLELPSTGVLWDLGAGSGSVAIECARLRPGLRVVAVERSQADVERIRANAVAHDVDVDVVHGDAADILGSLPAPDRVFVGGGGLGVLDAALDRLRPGGTVVATYALVDRAAAAWPRLGHMVQLSVSRAVPVGRVGCRLSAENPVFVCWGPASDPVQDSGEGGPSSR